MLLVRRATVHRVVRSADGRVLIDETRENVITLGQVDFAHAQVYGTSPGGNGLNYIGLSADAPSETTASTALSSEISSNGFSRAQGTVSHTSGTSVTTVQKKFTATGSQLVQKMALFTASSGGTMGHVLPLTSHTYTTGETDTITVTLTLASAGTLHPGHTLDASTIGMWRMNDAVAGDYAVRDAGPNARHCTTETGVSQIVPGPRSYQGPASGRTQGCLARFIRASTGVFTAANVGGEATTLTGNWTVKAWMRVSTAALSLVVNYSATGETLATNNLLQLGVTATGAVQVFWENGAGVDVNPLSTAGAFSFGTWHHIAAVKDDDTVNVGKKKVSFYVDGTFINTVSNLTNSAGGTSDQWFVGDGTNSPIGQFRSIMVTTNLSTSSDIAADAANTSGANAYTHTDTNVVVHFKCDELPDVWDDAGTYHMRRLNGAPPGTIAGTFVAVDPLVADSGSSRFFDGTTEYQGSNYLNSAIQSAMVSAFTLEAWVRLVADDPLSAQRGIFCFGNPAVETAVDNFAAVDILAAGTVQVDLEHGTGTNSTQASPSALFTASNKYNRHHLAVSYNGSTFDSYLDGAKVGATSSALTAFDTGTNDVPRLGIGNGSTTNRFRGFLDDVRLSNVARSAADILASYQAGA